MMNKTALLWLLMTWPLAASAQGDFAWQWPLELSTPDAGMYKITLNEEVYRASFWRDLRDVRVLDADGRVVDSARYPATEEVITRTDTIELPWFPLPAGARADSRDLELAVQRDANGRVTAIRESAAAAESVNPAWLIDLDEHAGHVHILHVQWADQDTDFDLGYRVDTSHDLRQWRVLESEVRLVQLHHDQRVLRQNALRLSMGTQQRYLRLTPLQAQPGALALQTLRAERMYTAAASDHWHWLELPVHSQGADGFEYHAPGFFPVQRLDVALPANSSVIWRVSHHDPGSAGKEVWPWRVLEQRWDTWDIRAADQPQRSSPLQLRYAENNRHWRLKPVTGALPSEALVLRLGWRPDRLVFLAQGRAPYRLVAGNASAEEDIAHGSGVIARRGDAIANGTPWQPGQARLGARQLLAGDAAYEPPMVPRDWKTWILWGVLILGSLIVALFALSVLRARPAAGAGEEHAE